MDFRSIYSDNFAYKPKIVIFPAYMYAYIQTYMHAYIHTYKHTHIGTHTQTRAHVCVELG